MDSEVATRADFSGIRYAQCWEDADILLEALDIQPGQTCFSVASGGDNTLAMLSRGPGRVIAVDLSPAQLACLELRVAAPARSLMPCGSLGSCDGRYRRIIEFATGSISVSVGRS